LPEHSPVIPIGLPFIELQSVDSTNNYALEQIHAQMARHGMAFFAHEQIAGKGQRGKGWVSEKGANIILSVIINPGYLSVKDQFQLSACVAVAVHDFFSRYAGDATSIKWPNDLYWQNRKAGGILKENVVGSTDQAIWKWAVAGIGININQTNFPPGLSNPVSLKQITGKNYNPVELARELCSILDNYYRQLMTEGFEDIYEKYVTHLYKRNESARLKKDSRIFDALIKTVTPTGQLVIQHAIEEYIDFGAVEWQ
jgi:BirA family biotin operon repressor/biotin-[acetyl-CoA-carboxylase] ligase